MHNQSLTRLMVLVVLALGAWNLPAALSSSSYIQNGLILQLDGVENVSRGGAHVGDSAVWNDLVSGGELYFPVSGDASFADSNALSVTNTWKSEAVGSKRSRILTVVKGKAYSAEIAYNETLATVLDPTWTSKRPAGQMLQFGHPRYWMGIDWNAGNRQTDCYVGFNPRGQGREPGINVLASLGATKIRGAHTLGVHQLTNDCAICFDGETVKTSMIDASADDSKSYEFLALTLNGGSSYANGGMNGLYHSVRFYNRLLENDERVINNAVDQVRYFGADASRLTLPNGWRFAGTGAAVRLEQLHYVSVFESRGGVVELVNSEESDKTELWLEYNVPTTVTLRATPDSGYEFLGWVGLSDASKKSQPEVTDAVTNDVMAVFAYVGAGARKLSALNYVTNGLVGHWDGIENVGYGLSHVSVAKTAWKDLRGTGADFSIPDAYTWQASGVDVVRGTSSYTASKADRAFAAFNAGAYTCEVAYRKVGETPESVAPSGKKYSVLLGFYYTTHFWFGLDGETLAGFHPNYESYGGSPNGLSHHAVTVTDNKGQHVLSCSQDGTKATVRFDRESTTENTTPSDPVTRLTRAEKMLALNRNYGSYDTGLNGTIHAVRFYDRALSADEYAVNFALDQVRFFGANPVECALPDGWRFNLSNGLAMERRYVASVNDPVMGTVRAGAGEAGTSVDCWVDGTTETVTLTAVPSDGYKFVRWEGAIEGANLKSPTGVFTVRGAVTAVFKKITGLAVIIK